MEKVLINGLDDDAISILMIFMASKLTDEVFISDVECGGNDCTMDFMEDGMDISGDDILHSLFDVYGVDEVDGHDYLYTLDVDGIIFTTEKVGDTWDDVYKIKEKVVITPRKKANILVEQFYQQAPEVLGTGRAQEFGKQMAIITANEVIVSLQKVAWNPQTVIDIAFWYSVVDELEIL